MLTLALVSAALASPPGWTVAPFGVGVYVHGKPGRGVTYTATQAAGIAALTWGSIASAEATRAEDTEGFARWQAVSIAGITLAAGSYLVSVLDGSRLHDLEEEGQAARDRVRAWDDARAFAAKER